MLRRLFTRALPSDLIANSFYMPSIYGPTQAGVYVNEQQVLGLAAAWRALNVITDNVASLPIHGYRSGTKLDTNPSLLERPNSTETRFDTLAKITYSLVLRGNAWGILGDFDQNLWPRQVEIVHPDLVNVTRIDGETTYDIAGTRFNRSELLHIKGLAVPGSLTGIGVVEAHREGFSEALAQREYAARQWNDSAVPSVNIKVDNPNLTPEQAQEIKQRWLAAHGSRQRTPSVMPSTYDVQTLSFTPVDSQYLESRIHSLTDIANMFGVPADRLGAPGSSRTYANVEQDEIVFVRNTLRPWLVRIEQAFTDLLPRGTEAKFNIDALLRSDTKSRYEAHALALTSGFLTLDEVRTLEDLTPLPPAIQQSVAQAVGAPSLLAARITTINEARNMVGLPSTADGDRFLTDEELAALKGNTA